MIKNLDEVKTVSFEKSQITPKVTKGKRQQAMIASDNEAAKEESKKPIRSP